MTSEFTYVNSGESSSGINFERLSDLIAYMEEIVAGAECFGFVFQDDEMIMKYKSRDTGITWLPIFNK